MPLRIAALLTCHNRREKTVACLRALRAQNLPGWNHGEESEKRKAKSEKQEHATGVTTKNEEPKKPASSPLSAESPDVSTFHFPLSTFSLEVFLVDDGCTDGTSDAVCEEWPEATIIQGYGNLFWCGGMRVAWIEAAKADPDYYLLLNDDTILYPNALEQLLKLCPAPSLETVSVGAICDPITRAWSYGGLQSDHEFPMPDGQPRPCRTMNANCTLIPRAVFKRLGMFHHAFRHAMGDMDYGLAATRSGIALMETHKFVGACSRNSIHGTWKDRKLSRSERLHKLVSPKGLPPSDWFAYCTRNCGLKWARFFLSPYMKILIKK